MQNLDTIFSVSDAAQLLKGVVESAFPVIKIRGELSGITRAVSGHVYLTIKDSGAAINAIIWRGTPIACKLIEGAEVITTGRFTTYPARSNYQIIVSEMEMAGVGAILKMLEDRKKKLAAEGLFDVARKKPLPKYPQTIGIVTSPTGAAFQDIINRLKERFPVRVLLYPAQVQGESAANEIAAGIKFFNSLDSRPDVIIVARGGGSLEDLLPFSEEIVVRAAAMSEIPLISGVGHEPDWMLIDFAADVRAPTPTGAAEIVVPTKLSLISELENLSHRLVTGFAGALNALRHQMTGTVVKSPRQMIMERAQRLDDVTRTMGIIFVNKLASLKQSVAIFDNFESMLKTRFAILNQNTAHLGQMLSSLSYKNVLARGYAIVRSDGKIVSRSAEFSTPAEIEFADGVIVVN